MDTKSVLLIIVLLSSSSLCLSINVTMSEEEVIENSKEKYLKNKYYI